MTSSISSLVRPWKIRHSWLFSSKTLASIQISIYIYCMYAARTCLIFKSNYKQIKNIYKIDFILPLVIDAQKSFQR